MKGRNCDAAGSSVSGFMSQWEQLLSMLLHVLKDSKNPTVAGAKRRHKEERWEQEAASLADVLTCLEKLHEKI